MECATLICLMNLFQPQNLYVTGQIFTPLNNAQSDWEGAWCTKRFCRGPVGELRIGLKAPVTRTLELDLGITHRSYIQEGDRGQESLYAAVTWRPWR